VVADGAAVDDEWARSSARTTATAEVDKVKAKSKSKKKSKENKGWPAQAANIESVVNCAAVHKVMESVARSLRHF
jgi:hypothetical protein